MRSAVAEIPTARRGGPSAARPHATRNNKEPVLPEDATKTEEPSPQLPAFAEMPLSERMQHDIAEAGFVTPLPIQAQTILPALEGKDIIGLAATGTGKTAAFAIPMIERIRDLLDIGGLVLAPTRELANQIHSVFMELGGRGGIRPIVLVGGMPMDDDLKALRSWPNVIIATPGRLIDHIRLETVALSHVEMFTIDEADRMHDMGFIPQINQIMRALPAERQTLMFTATMAPDIECIARGNMNDPIRVEVGIQAPAQGARQMLYRLSDDAKRDFLTKLVRRSEGRVLVFCRTKVNVDRVTRTLGRAVREPVARLHSGREQAERDDAMEGFRSGECRILVATDIAARGLDVAAIEHVVNYDFPMHPEDYIHRVGRTARVDETGHATTFVTPADGRYVSALFKLLGQKLVIHEPDGSVSDWDPCAGRGRGGSGSRGANRSNRRRSKGRRR